MEHCIRQNNAVDNFQEYLEDEKEVEGRQEPLSAKTSNVLDATVNKLMDRR